MSSCIKCGCANKPGAKFCKSCGEKLDTSASANEMRCNQCKSPLQPNAKFCKQCGTAVSSKPVQVDVSESAPREVGPVQAPVSVNESITPIQSTSQTKEVSGINVAGNVSVPPSMPSPVVKKIEPARPTIPEPSNTQSAAILEEKSGLGSEKSKAGNFNIGIPMYGKVIATCCLLAVVGAGGAYIYIWKTSPSQNAVTQLPAKKEIAVATPPPSPSPSPPIPAPQQASTPSLEKPVEIETPVADKPIVKPEVKSEVKAKPANTPKVDEVAVIKNTKPAITTVFPNKSVSPTESASNELNTAIARKVAGLLSKASGYIENKQYDKAIAIGESALELDPNSNAAKTMISNAKAKQLEALRSSSILE